MDETMILRNCKLTYLKYGANTIKLSNGKTKTTPEQWNISLQCSPTDNQRDIIKSVYDDVGESWIPKWVKVIDQEEELSIFLHSQFPIEVREGFRKDDKVIVKNAMAIEDIVYGEDCECDFKIRLKDGAIYPDSCVILKNGSYTSDRFSDF